MMPIDSKFPTACTECTIVRVRSGSTKNARKRCCRCKHVKCCTLIPVECNFQIIIHETEVSTNVQCLNSLPRKVCIYKGWHIIHRNFLSAISCPVNIAVTLFRDRGNEHIASDSLVTDLTKRSSDFRITYYRANRLKPFLL